MIFNNKLYYNYLGDNASYGTYEIDRNGSRRVQWHGVELKNPYLERFEVFKGNLLIDKITKAGEIFRYNIETGSEESFTKLKGAKENKYLTYDIADGRMYIFSKDKIYVSDDGVNTSVIFDKFGDIEEYYSEDKLLYIKDNCMTFVSKDERVKKYDFKTKKYVFNKKLKINLETEEKENLLDHIESVSVADNNIIIVASDEWKTNFYNASDGFKLIYSVNHSGWCYNVYENNIYLYNFGKYEDIYSVDINTGKAKTLIEGGEWSVMGVYILGDKWVYYVLDDDALYRITKDGKTTEKIFG